MDVTLGKILPPGVADYATKLSDQLRTQAPQTLQPAQNESAIGGSGVFESFSSLLSQALQDVNQVHLEADAGAQKLVAGEEVDVHQVMIGMEKANVAFGLTLQVRNKLVEAYQEIMRMQV